MTRRPKIDARLAPMRSCMIADCLRSTQPRMAATLRTNTITKATRPNAMPESRITGSPRLRLALPPTRPSRRRLHAMAGRLGRGGGGRAGEHRHVGADGLIGEGRERGHRLRQLTEPELGAPERSRAAEHVQDAAEQIPAGERVAERLDGRAKALDATEKVGEGPV